MRRVLVTGFGAFLDVADNPSRTLARALAARPPAGTDVRAVELDVRFDAVREGLDGALATLGREGWRPELLLGLGVHRGPALRIERAARRMPSAKRRDNSGVQGIDYTPPDDERHGARLETALDLAPLVAAAVRVGATWTWISHDAGGYVCERAYYRLLHAARETGARALFVHVPHAVHLPLGLQRRVLAAMVAELRERG